MRRKIIRQGSSTLTLSLPAKWVKEHRLAAGDEVDVEESTDALSIVPLGKVEKAGRIEVDVSSLFPLVNRVIRAKYVKGVDEISVKFKDAQQLKDIQQRALPDLLGYVIVEQTARSVLLRDVTHPAPEEFDVMFRRIFLLLVSMGDAFEKGEKEASESVLAMEQNINRNVNFCLRLCSKRVVHQSTAVQSALVLLELLGDTWKEFANSAKGQLSAELRSLIGKYNRFFHSLYELWFEFEMQKAVALGKKYQELEGLLSNPKVGSKDAERISILRKLSSNSVVLLGLLLSR
ncbi:phosphate uptake regulator PhoU [Candidatus Woesearchaeota archaeon]|nr:phosphate uptake regulator PhoU [Candidatus Woesearchaeota archaeon]